MKFRKKLVTLGLIGSLTVCQSLNAFAATFSVTSPVLISKSVVSGKATVHMKATVTANVSSYCLGVEEWFTYSTSYGAQIDSKKMINQSTASVSSFTYDPAFTDGTSAVSVESITAQGFRRSGPTGTLIYIEKKTTTLN